MKVLPAILILSGLTSACASQGEFPSLAKRPFESGRAAVSSAPAPTPQLVSNPALLAKVEAALNVARASVAPFNAQLAKSAPLVEAARGAASGSERWIDGQLAASRLEPLLAPAAAALSDIDAAYREALTSTNSANLATIEAALTEASEIATHQSQESARLTASLPQ